jgi:hypothetical protein
VAFAEDLTHGRARVRRATMRTHLNSLIDQRVRLRLVKGAPPAQGAPQRKQPVAVAAGGRGPFRLLGELARYWQGLARIGLSACGRSVAPPQRLHGGGGEFETMNKKSIAPRVSLLYPPSGSAQVVTEAKRFRLLRFIWRSSVPKLHALKRGLMHFTLFWRRLSILAGEIRTQVMVEIERNPLAVRQGAATIMCLAAAAVAMPVISHRAAEQRDGAEWAVTSTAFQAQFEQQLMAGTDPAARGELTSFRSNDG